MERIMTNRLLLSLTACCALAAGAFAGIDAGRSLPVRMTFDTADDGGVSRANTGAFGGLTARLDPEGYANWVSDGAFGTQAYDTKSNAMVLGDGSYSLGADAETGFALSFHVKTTQRPEDWANFFGLTVGDTVLRFEMTAAEKPALYCFRKAGGSMGPESLPDPSGSVTMQTGTWAHMMLVYAQGSLRLYYNGELAEAYTAKLSGAVTELVIGAGRRSADMTRRSANFLLDDVALFSEAPGAEDIAWLKDHSADGLRGGFSVADKAVASLTNPMYIGALTLGSGAEYTETQNAGFTHVISRISGPREGTATFIKAGDGETVLDGAVSAAETQHTVVRVDGGIFRVKAPAADWGEHRNRLGFEVARDASLYMPSVDIMTPTKMDVAGDVWSQGWFADFGSVGTLTMRGGLVASDDNVSSGYAKIGLPGRIALSERNGELRGTMNLLHASTEVSVAPGLTLTAGTLISHPNPKEGPRSLRKTGDGTLVLNGGTYTGTTAVEAGCLTMRGTHTGTGDLTVNAGASLKLEGAALSAAVMPAEGAAFEGYGTVGALHITGDRILKPVKSGLTVTGELHIAEGATLTVDLSGFRSIGWQAAPLKIGSCAAPGQIKYIHVPSTYRQDRDPETGGLTLTVPNYRKTAVVRIHPLLTRGLDKEALIGIRPYGGGYVRNLEYTVSLKNCRPEDITGFTLWSQWGQADTEPGDCGAPEGKFTYPVPGFMEYKATRFGELKPTAVTQEADGSVTFTLTYKEPEDQTNKGYWIYGYGNQQPGWEGSRAGLWLTAQIRPDISVDAEIRVAVRSLVLSDSGRGSLVAAEDVKTVPPHRILKQRFRITTYLRNDFATGAGGLWAGDPLDDRTRERLTNLTDIYHIDVFPIRNAEGLLDLSWNRKLVWQGGANRPISDDIAWKRITDRRSRLGLSNRDLRVKLCLTRGASQGGPGENPAALGDVLNDAVRFDFVRQIVDKLEEIGGDGLDIDWEYPANANEFRAYALLVRDLSEAFFPHGWELSVCTGISWRHAPRGVLQHVDYISSMAYDGGALNAPLSKMTEAIRVLNVYGVPNRRITVGQVMYGSRTQPGWNSIVGTAGWNGGYTGYDCDMILYRDAGQVTFTGPTTYRAKVAYCRDNNFGGVMSWGYYSDVAWDNPHSLARHQARTLWPITAYRWPTPEQDADGTYLLDSEEDWFWFADHAASIEKAALSGDILFAHDIKPAASFAGTLDGRGYTLILPKDVWICTYDDAALILDLNGTIRNLNIDVAGRIISRRDRKNDASSSGWGTIELSSRGGDGAYAAVLAARLNGGGALEKVNLTVREGAEIRGHHEAGALVGQFWCPADSSAALTDCTVDFAGSLNTRASDSIEKWVGMNANADAGILIGQMNWADDATSRVIVERNTVVLRPTAEVLSDCGNHGGAGGAIGNLNKSLPDGFVTDLRVQWSAGASVESKQGAASDFRAQPWIACRLPATSREGAPILAVHGALTVLGNGFPWTLEQLWLKETGGDAVLTQPTVAFDSESGAETPAELTPAERNALYAALPPLAPGVKTLTLASPTDAAALTVFTGLTLSTQGTPTEGRQQLAVSEHTFGVSDLRFADGRLILDASVTGADFAPQARICVQALQPDGSFADLSVAPSAAAPGYRSFSLPADGNGTHLYRVRVFRP